MRVPFKVALALGLVAIITLAGCAQPAGTTTPTTSPTTTPTTTPTSTTKPPPTAAGPSGELRFAVTTLGNEKFDPVTADATHIGNVLAPMIDYLFWAEGSTLQPRLVEKWELAPDGLSWTYTIHKDVKFHNGDTLTAKDVKFSIEQFMRTDAYRKYIREMVDRVEIVDDLTVSVFTKGKQPYLPNMQSMLLPYQGAVMPKDYVERVGIEGFKRNPVGSGSYKFVRYVPADMIEFEAMTSHWRRVPEFKKLSVIVMPEETTQVASLKTGAVDVIEVGLESAISLENNGYKTHVVEMNTPMFQFHGVFDSRAAGMPTTNIKVRQALSLAVDREEIKSSFFYGKAGPAMPGFLWEGSDDIDVAYWRDYVAKMYKYDPTEAKKLLTEAGYPNGFNIKFYTFAPAGGTYLPKLAQIIQAYWARVDVKAELVPIEMGTYTTWRTGPAKELVGNSTMYRFNPGQTLTNLSAGFESTGTQNLLGRGNANSDKFDQLLRAAMVETDTAKRQAMIAEAVKISVDSWTAIQISSAPAMAAIGPRADITDFPRLLPSRYLPTYADLVKQAKS